MFAGWLSVFLCSICRCLKWRRALLYPSFIAAGLIFPVTDLVAQGGPGLQPHPESAWEEEVRKPHAVWYLPGANFGSHGDTNLFTRIYCRRMNEIMPGKFHIVKCSGRPYAANNVIWALWNGQYPLKNPRYDRRIRNSVDSMLSDSLFKKSHITLISSSYGTVVAAQMALYLVNNFKELGLQPEPINLVFASAMLSKESRLYKELERARGENKIGFIVYDELQYAGDNVTGMCGKSRLFAFSEVIRIACPFIGKYRGQPSIFNKDPVNGHIHRKREINGEKVEDYIIFPLIEYQLAGNYHKMRAMEFMGR